MQRPHLGKGSTALLFKFFTERHQQVLAGNPHAVGEGVLVLVLHEAVRVLAPLCALLLCDLIIDELCQHLGVNKDGGIPAYRGRCST